MQLSFLLDENVEIDSLGPGTPDSKVRQYARETDRTILTYDDHVTDSETDNIRVFYCPEQQLQPFDVFRIITAVVDNFDDCRNLPPVVFLSENWL